MGFKNLFFCCFTLLFCGNLTLAQCPQSENEHSILLDTQAAIDSFAILYPDCTEILKGLDIGSRAFGSNPIGSSDINDLSGLSQITSVESLQISNNDSLTSLSGLENIVTSGSLSILFNKNLVDLSGLENLTALKLTSIIDNENLVSLKGLENVTSMGSLQVRCNINLPNLSGLEGLVEVGSLSFYDNSNLMNLDGLESLTSIYGELYIINNNNLLNINSLAGTTLVRRRISIQRNDNLTSLNGLENITTLESSLSISFNNSLTNLNGLKGITTVGDEGLGIVGNNILTDLNGLNNLTSIAGQLKIEDNIALTDLSHIQSAAYNNLTSLWVRNNTSLSVCNSEGICKYLENDRSSFVQNNAVNCNSADEVLARCTVSTTSFNHLPKINIYPNPTKGIFSLPGIPNSTYQIHHISGQLIQQGGMQNDLLIDISDEVQGVYFISVTIKDETFVQRVVKK